MILSSKLEILDIGAHLYLGLAKFRESLGAGFVSRLTKALAFRSHGKLAFFLIVVDKSEPHFFVTSYALLQYYSLFFLLQLLMLAFRQHFSLPPLQYKNNISI